MNAPSPANILIIDNDEGFLQAVRTRLSGLGYQCRIAVNGAQGLSEFDPQRVNLVITDLNMPTMNGLEVIRRIRRRGNVPVIVITGYPTEYGAALARQQDVAVLAKPFDSQELIDLVTAELAMRRGRLAG